jgi:hypothetical protein
VAGCCDCSDETSCSGAMELGTGWKLNEIDPYRNIVKEAD